MKYRRIITSALIVGAIAVAGTDLAFTEINQLNRTIEKRETMINKQTVTMKETAKKYSDLQGKYNAQTEDLAESREYAMSLANSIKQLKTDQTKHLDGKTYIAQRHLTIHASAYSQSDEEETGDGITFTETKVTNHRTVAVDPKLIPLGSLLYIESSSPLVGGFYVAEDIGGAIKGSRMDIFMSSKKDCFTFGRQDVQVTILKPL